MRWFFFRFVFIEYPHFAQLAVGAYCIRLENIHVDKCVHSGVCDTPLHGLFADIHIVLSLRFLPATCRKFSQVCNSLPTLWGSFPGLGFLADAVGKLSWLGIPCRHREEAFARQR
ncbi:hypothetical protein B5G04_11655 [Bacteroides sp. An51A]|nr:hypothetical protein B5G04_11655 [Bacteroides sp. An51A]